MDERTLKKVRQEFNQLKKRIQNATFEADAVEKIDYGLYKIQRLLDPRPPVTEDNFCPKCGHQVNVNYRNLGMNNDFLEM